MRDRDRSAYEAAKYNVVQQVIDQLEVKLGDIKERAKGIDIATPTAIIRYTHNWQGSHMGWAPSVDLLATRSVPKTLPELDRFYMTGHWVESPGGVLLAA